MSARIAVDASSVTNLSGRRLFRGHIGNLAAACVGTCSLHILHGADNRDLRCDLGNNVEWIACPHRRTWPARLAWQARSLGGTLRAIGAGLLVSMSGTLSVRAGIPQVVVAPNAWCFFADATRGAQQRVKAALQRVAYRHAQRHAAGLFYVSKFLADCYARIGGEASGRTAVIGIGVDDVLFVAQDAVPSFEQRRFEVVCVAEMARHKQIESVVDALALVRREGVPARLVLVGPWPDAAYRADVERSVAEHGLRGHVDFAGRVDASELARYYRGARVFCLMSHCESFGIPAVEAQASGTPCVVPDRGAPLEIAGPGAITVPPGERDGTAAALIRLLTDAAAWNAASRMARANAERFRWERVSEPLVRFVKEWALAQ